MANSNAPNGFRPRLHADGTPWNSALNRYPIAYNYGTAIGIGDPVKLVSGKLQKAGATDQIHGIVNGFEYPKTATWGAGPAFWPAGGIATLGNADVYALVIDDPNILFEAQFGNALTVAGFSLINQYFKQYDAGVNPATGISGMGIDVSTAQGTGAGAPWRLIKFLERVDNDLTSPYIRGYFMPVLHDFRASAAAA